MSKTYGFTKSHKIPAVPKDATDDWYQLVDNPKDLKRKVPSIGGIDREKAFAEADRIMASLAGEYFNKLGDDIKALEDLTVKFKADKDAAHLEEVYRLVHNMRGQGASFDFPLVSAIGTSFCKYAVARKNQDKFSFELVVQHLEALKIIYRENIKGEGSALAKAVVATLQQAVIVELGRE